MLKITPFELFFALIPEAFIFLYGAHVFTNSKLNYKRILVSALIIGVFTYLVRLLPIFPGVNIIIVMVLSTLMLVLFNKIETMRAIPASLILFVIRIGTEYLNVVMLDKVLNLSVDDLLKNAYTKTLAIIPSLLLFALILFLYHRYRLAKSKGKSNVSN